MAKSVVQEFTKGLWSDIPPFRLVLGLCPILAVTKSLENGVGMGVAVIFVLVCSNVLISLLRNVIPKKVRIACFIIVIATFVTVVELFMQAYAYPVSSVRDIYSLDRGELHTPRPGRGICRQEQGYSLTGRRPRHWHRLYSLLVGPGDI